MNDLCVSDKAKNNMTCSRPDCQNQVAPGEYFVSGIAGRKLRYDPDGNITVLYLVKWDGCAALPQYFLFFCRLTNNDSDIQSTKRHGRRRIPCQTHLI